MCFVYLRFGEICIDLFSKLLLEYAVFSNVALLWIYLQCK